MCKTDIYIFDKVIILSRTGGEKLQLCMYGLSFSKTVLVYSLCYGPVLEKKCVILFKLWINGVLILTEPLDYVIYKNTMYGAYQSNASHKDRYGFVTGTVPCSRATLGTIVMSLTY